MKFYDTTLIRNLSSKIECQGCSVNSPVWLQAHLESPDHKAKYGIAEIIPIERIKIMLVSQKLDDEWEKIKNEIDQHNWKSIEVKANGHDAQYYCTFCDQFLRTKNLNDIKRHFAWWYHKQSVIINGKCARDFDRGLFNAMVYESIALSKLDHNHNGLLRKWLEEYCWEGMTIPTGTSLRSRFTNLRYGQLLDDVRSEVGNVFIAITTDKTMDKNGRSLMNFTIKSLSRPNIGPFTLGFVRIDEFIPGVEQFYEQRESEKIAKILDDFVQNLYGDSYEDKKYLVLILTTDSAAPNIAAAKILINEYYYVKLIHVGCVVHGLHNLTKGTPALFKDLDDLITGVKHVFRYQLLN